jgi:ABC-type branched-subunit amino acid transport system ATPase component
MELNISSLTSGYGQVRIVNNVSLRAKPAEIIAVIGRNGVGKTTLIKTIIGILPPMAGTIGFGAIEITRLSATARARLGIGYVPQGRGIFTRMTVAANRWAPASVLPSSRFAASIFVLSVLEAFVAARRLDERRRAAALAIRHILARVYTESSCSTSPPTLVNRISSRTSPGLFDGCATNRD